MLTYISYDCTESLYFNNNPLSTLNFKVYSFHSHFTQESLTIYLFGIKKNKDLDDFHCSMKTKIYRELSDMSH